MLNERKERIIEGICKIDQYPAIAFVGNLSADQIVEKLHGKRGIACRNLHPTRTLADGFDWDPLPKKLKWGEIMALELTTIFSIDISP